MHGPFDRSQPGGTSGNVVDIVPSSPVELGGKRGEEEGGDDSGAGIVIIVVGWGRGGGGGPG
jgi:hypothetical protein